MLAIHTNWIWLEFDFSLHFSIILARNILINVFLCRFPSTTNQTFWLSAHSTMWHVQYKWDRLNNGEIDIHFIGGKWWRQNVLHATARINVGLGIFVVRVLVCIVACMRASHVKSNRKREWNCVIVKAIGIQAFRLIVVSSVCVHSIGTYPSKLFRLSAI